MTSSLKRKFGTSAKCELVKEMKFIAENTTVKWVVAETMELWATTTTKSKLESNQLRISATKNATIR